YEQGKCLQAYRYATRFGPLQGWKGTGSRVLAGRLAQNLGAPRLGISLLLKAHRRDPKDPLALYYYARTLLLVRGPVAALAFLREASKKLESASIQWRLLHHQSALGKLEDARKSLNRLVELSPLAEKDMTKRIVARRADLFYLLGDVKGAVEELAKVGTPY